MKERVCRVCANDRQYGPGPAVGNRPVSVSTVGLLSSSSWLFTTDNLLREGTRDKKTKQGP